MLHAVYLGRNITFLLTCVLALAATSGQQPLTMHCLPIQSFSNYDLDSIEPG